MTSELQFRFDFHNQQVVSEARRFALRGKKKKVCAKKLYCAEFESLEDINGFSQIIVAQHPHTFKIIINFLDFNPSAEQVFCQAYLSPLILNTIIQKCRFVTQMEIKNYAVQDYRQNQKCLLFLKKVSFFSIYTPSFVSDFLEKSTFKYLRWLQIRNTRIKNKGLQILAKGGWNNLQYLSIRSCGFSSDGLKYLTKHTFNSIRTIALKQKLNNDGQRMSLKLRSEILLLDSGFIDFQQLKFLFVNEIVKVDKLSLPRKVCKTINLYQSRVLLAML